MRTAIDRTNQRFGRLTAISKHHKDKKRNEWHWLCKCDCGTTVIVAGSNLGSRNTRSCGCLGYNAGGMSNTSVYRRWQAMLNKCYNQKSYKYDQFGGIEIVVCDRWRESFKNFYADMGDPPPGYQLARRNIKKSFNPKNCYWATPRDAHVNNPNAQKRLIEFRGKLKSVTEWAKELNIKRSLLFSRLNRGWSIEKAITTPVNEKPKGGPRGHVTHSQPPRQP